MNYITSQEAADKWGLTRRIVQLYCQNGRIPGAVNPGKQWLIPEDAERPKDTRFSEHRHSAEAEPYHFPLLVYTRHYASRSELSEDECVLLDAQLLNMRGEFSESVRHCKMLLNEAVSPSVRFGAWLTCLSSYMFLGLASEMTACWNAMESLYSSAPSHREDYRLILAFFDHTYRFDPSRFLTIDVTKLSPDAMTTYKLISMGAALFSSEDSPESSIRFYGAVCKETELIGIAPASLTMHALLSMLHSRRGNRVAMLRHVEEACRTGYEHGLVRLLAKCSTLDIDTYGQCLRKYGEDYASDIRERCIRYRSCWQLAYTTHSGPNPAIDVNIFEAEIALLLVFKTPLEDIAMLKNTTVREVRKAIRELCARLSLKSKKELVELFRTIYCSAPGEKSAAVMSGGEGE